MPLNPETESEPIVEVLDNLAPPHLHAAAWATCMGKGWYFGHGSVAGGGVRFWRMDLDGDAAFQAIWEHVRGRCEELAGGPLRVVTQYANGHTYGLGGNVHLDDTKAGAYTLLYYPNPEWQEGWDGETVFYDEHGEIALAVRPRPNRAVFFDGRVPHCGKAPSRSCEVLRVSVAFKLERTGAAARAEEQLSRTMGLPAEAKTSGGEVDVEPAKGPTLEEARREGARREYRGRCSETAVTRLVDKRLEKLAGSVRLPGFRPGNIPRAVLEERYGKEARAWALRQLAFDAINRGLPAGSIASVCNLVAGEESGPLEMVVIATHLPDLPLPDFSDLVLERLVTDNPTPEQTAYLQTHLKLQLLNQLDSQYSIPVFPPVVELEFRKLWTAAESKGLLPQSDEERGAMATQIRGVAERRLRLGMLITELGRRFQIQASSGAELEERTLNYLLAKASLTDRRISNAELSKTIQEQWRDR